MEKLYTIKGDNVEIILSKEIYPLVVIKKALVNFIDEIYIKIDDSRTNEFLVLLSAKESSQNMKKIVGELYNELLRESLRYSISIETKNLRELIVGRALYTTCIELDEKRMQLNDEENDLEKHNEYKLEDIAVNWFDKYRNEEEQKC